MKDIPVFTTENGAASLILKEIPVRQTAYIKLLSSEAPELLLRECLDFCRACGAESVFASGDGISERYPVSATLMEMRGYLGVETDAALFPVTKETVGEWRDICNSRMKDVPNAAYFTRQDEKMLLEEGDCYFVHRDCELLGIGKASGDTIELIASVKRGCGKIVLLALGSLLDGPEVRLVVARENTRAVALYEGLGMVAVRQVSRWHKIL